MRLGRFSKTPSERKRYAIDYSEWLDTGETVVSYTFAATPVDATTTFTVDASSLGSAGTSIVFFVSGGSNNSQYTVDVKAATSGGQVKEDTILFTVRDAS
ncbi:hypothetical protein UFOVP55_5 [uncultured Caudovirales phage]|uniref:Uncharacterized protein n=1 Tax=uncultured Caudovirales phage TaxID=2100421 RepID=A0A6J5KQ73_9CAUD|nr:hypothetical protein UFOVP55_5 [uncultured Caudovirales phage]